MQGLEARSGQGEGIGLVFEGSDSGIKPALAALRGQGAVILDRCDGSRVVLGCALGFAESRGVPVVVLASPPRLSAERLQYGFDFGAGIDG